MSNGPHFLSGRHIVVAGAGIAGLSFVVALRKLWLTGVPPPRITIFERDSEHDALGREGYSLSLAGFNNTGVSLHSGTSVYWTRSCHRQS
jgi:2-polyprenyl-6-methoxyphenol hydroxylase-like FAD-dependent oxidoreductase